MPLNQKSASWAFSPSRQAWALVSVIGGGNASCSEAVREHENHDTGGRALARRNFTTADGVGFSVTAYSEWKNGEEEPGFALLLKSALFKDMENGNKWFNVSSNSPFYTDHPLP